MHTRRLVVACALLGAVGTAHAQYAPPPPQGYQPAYQPAYAPGPPGYREEGIHRRGLVIGGSIGPAAFGFNCRDDCDSLGALGFNLEIGGMVAPNVAILFDWTDHLHPFSDGSVLSSNLFDGAIRVFFARILWVEAGIGLGVVQASDPYGYYTDSAWGLGAMGAFGIEVLQTRNFAIDLSARLSGARVSENGDGSNVTNFALLIGAHWY